MMGPGEYDKDASISVSHGATHYIGLSMADLEALVREARAAAKFCWSCGCQDMWHVYRTEAMKKWPWLEDE